MVVIPGEKDDEPQLKLPCPDSASNAELSIAASSSVADVPLENQMRVTCTILARVGVAAPKSNSLNLMISLILSAVRR